MRFRAVSSERKPPESANTVFSEMPGDLSGGDASNRHNAPALKHCQMRALLALRDYAAIDSVAQQLGERCPKDSGNLGWRVALAM